MKFNIDQQLLKIINHVIGDEEKTLQTNEVVNKLPPCPSIAFEPAEDDGFIEVRDHQLFVFNPKNNGRAPVLLPSKRLQIKVNGKQITKPTIVCEKDSVEWKITEEKLFEIFINKEKMKVILQLSPFVCREYILKDKRRSFRFLLEVEEIPKSFDKHELYSQIVEKTQEMGIGADLKMDVIYRELSNPTFEQLVIAEGLEVIQSRDGTLELLFSEQKEEEYIEDSNGKIDFKNRVKIPSVNAGDLIAIVHPHREGKTGVNVFGEVIYPKPPQTIKVKAKVNVKMTDDGKIYALNSGRPTVTGRVVKYIDILPAYEIQGDVSMETGNIFFHGDVLIHGNVNENMRVESLGSVIVRGSVYSSTIIAAQNISVKGVVIKSRLYAGSNGILYSQIYDNAQQLGQIITNMLFAFHQIEETLIVQKQNIRCGYIFSMLAEKKYKGFVNLVRYIYDLILEIENLSTEVPMQFKLLKRFFGPILEKKNYLLQLESPAIFGSMQKVLKGIIEICENSIHEDSLIDLGESNMSVIKTNGSITFNKGGAIQSTIFAGKDIMFLDKKAVIRGSKIHATKQIIGGIVGNKGMDSPYLIANERIYLNEIRNGKITMNGKTIQIDKIMENIEFLYEPQIESIIHYSLDNEIEAVNE